MEKKTCPNCDSENIAQYVTIEVLQSLLTDSIIIEKNSLEPIGGKVTLKCLNCMEEFDDEDMYW